MSNKSLTIIQIVLAALFVACICFLIIGIVNDYKSITITLDILGAVSTGANFIVITVLKKYN